MEKIITISNAIAAVSGAAISVGALVYCCMIYKAGYDNYKKEKD